MPGYGKGTRSYSTDGVVWHGPACRPEELFEKGDISFKSVAIEEFHDALLNFARDFDGGVVCGEDVDPWSRYMLIRSPVPG